MWLSCCTIHCSQYNLTVSTRVSKHLVETTLLALADITKRLVGVVVGVVGVIGVGVVRWWVSVVGLISCVVNRCDNWVWSLWWVGGVSVVGVVGGWRVRLVQVLYDLQMLAQTAVGAVSYVHVEALTIFH